MNLLLVAATTLCITAVPLAADPQSSDLEAKISMAQDYLLLLKVPYKKQTLGRSDKKDLLDAFDSWRKTPDDKWNLSGDPPRSLMPNGIDRLLRVSSFKTEWVQTPQYVFGILEGSAPGTPGQLVRNPNYALWSFGGVITPSELYVSIANRISMCTAAEAIWAKTDNLKCNDASFLSGSRLRDGFGRLASAMTITVNTSQIPRFQNGVIVSDATIARGTDYTFTIQGSFDPNLLFRSAAEWKSWGEYYAKHPKLKLEGHERPSECPTTAVQPGSGDTVATRDVNTAIDSCFKRIARGTLFQQTITSILPKVDVRAFTAFDFYKTGLNTFLPTPVSGRALYDITGTWDLRKVLPSAETRVQALQAAKALVSKPSDEKQQDGSWKAQVEMLYLDLLEKPGLALNQDWWDKFHDLVYKHL